MIRNDAELEVTRNLLALARSAYDSLRGELLPSKPKAFAVLSQGYIDEIAGLQGAINDYLQIPV